MLGLVVSTLNLCENAVFGLPAMSLHKPDATKPLPSPDQVNGVVHEAGSICEVASVPLVTMVGLVLYQPLFPSGAVDGATYTDADMAARLVDGKWVFTHKDGSPYK